MQKSDSLKKGSALKDSLTVLGYGIAYFFAHQIAFFFPNSEQIIMAVWPAGGIGLAAFLLCKRPLWPWLIFTFYIAGIGADVFFAHRPFGAGLGYMTANMVESIGCALLLVHWCGRGITFTTRKEIVVLLIGMIFVNALSTSIGAGTAFFMQHASFSTAWLSWYVSDGLGILIIAPVIVTWMQSSKVHTPWQRRLLLESFLYMILWCTAIWFSFLPNSHDIPLALHPYMLITLLVWPALRLGQRMVALSLFVLAIIAIISLLTHNGTSPLGGNTKSEELLQVQLFLAFAAVTGFFLAATYAESKTAEQSARDHQARLNNALDNAPFPIMIHAEDGKVEFVNSTWTELTGYKHSDIPTTVQWAEKAYGQQKIIVQKEIDDLYNLEGKKNEGEYQIKTTSGKTLVWDFSSASLGKLTDGRRAVISMAKDVSDRTHAEEALRDSESRFRELTENSLVGIMIAQDGFLRYVNPAMSRIFGYEPDDLINTDPLLIMHPDDHEMIKENIRRRIAGEVDILHYESRGIHKNGNIIFLEVLGARTFFNGTPAIIGNIMDITARKQSEKEREKIDHVLNQTQKLESLGILAGGIAHDFNNLLGGIFGYIDLAHENANDPKTESHLEKALGTLDRARGLTRQLLTFAKGGAPIKAVDNLFPFVQETVQFALSGSNVSGKFTIDKDLWQCNFDKNQIGQVIDNLTINAYQSMPDGGAIDVFASNITLKEHYHSSLAAGKYVRISIQDHGCGISQDSLPHIYDPFYTTKPKGHGLGLTTCYSIVKRHDGCIDVESEVGKGTVFHVYLPASCNKENEIKVSDQTIHIGKGTFLIMDDEEVMRDTIEKILVKLGYSVLRSANGKEAIDIFTADYHDLKSITAMIFDLTVPGAMGGKEAIQHIRAVDKHIPAFVTSGYAENPVMANPQEYGFTASICKPFRIFELSQLLEAHLHKSTV